MATIALIFDYRPEYLYSLPETPSLLCLPLGTGNVLDAFLQKIHPADPDRIYIVTPHEDTTGISFLKSICSLEFVFLDHLQDLIEGQESGDHIVVYDSRYWADDLPLASELIETSQREKTLACFAALNADTKNASERILLDHRGDVKRIRRLYDKVSWLQGNEPVVLCAAMPQQLAESTLSYPISPTRTTLAAQGLPSRDRLSAEHLFDLDHPQELLELNRRMISRQIDNGKKPRGYRLHCSNVLIAEGVGLHPSVSILGPVVIQTGARIEPDATIVGPCVVGRDSLVKRKALIARSLLPEGCIVEPTKPLVDAVGRGHSNGQTNLLGRKIWHNPMSWQNGHENQHSHFRYIRQKKLYFLFKRCIDITGAVVGILLCLPFMPIIILLQQMDSPGPIFFVHRREGRGQREFPCFKLRTMCSNAHKLQRQLYSLNEVDGPQFNLANDERITRFGAWLRKLNVDELPQLINVLLGHMSLVGPRPSPFRENQICVPWRQARLTVRPGITGLWQICRHNRKDEDFSQWIRYDVAYVRHMSLSLDLKILCYTAISLVSSWRYVPLEQLLPGNVKKH